MSEAVRRVADAILYEGYILYPYRPSVKNRQRWTFGGLYPEAFCRDQRGSDAPSSRTECLIRGSRDSVVDITVRFLHLTQRQVGLICPPLGQWPARGEPAFQRVEALQIGEQMYQGWQEAE
jgi:hydrogenase maturation protease